MSRNPTREHYDRDQEQWGQQERDRIAGTNFEQERLQQSGDAELAAMVDHAGTAARFEWAFWDSAYHGKDWPSALRF